MPAGSSSSAQAIPGRLSNRSRRSDDKCSVGPTVPNALTKPLRELRRRQAVVGRENGDAFARLAGGVQLGTYPQAMDDDVRDGPQHARILVHDLVESLPRHPDERAVADRDDARGPGLAGEHRHLPYALATRHFAQDPAVGRHGAQPPADDEVEVVPFVARGKQPLAGSQLEPLHPGLDEAEHLCVDGTEQLGHVDGERVEGDPLADAAGHLLERGRVRCGDPLEARPPDTDQHRIGHRGHRRAVFAAAGQDRELPGDLARAQVPQNESVPSSRRIVARRVPVAIDIQRVGGLSGAQQNVARGQRHPLEVGVRVREQRVAKQRESFGERREERGKIRDFGRHGWPAWWCERLASRFAFGNPANLARPSVARSVPVPSGMALHRRRRPDRRPGEPR